MTPLIAARSYGTIDAPTTDIAGQAIIDRRFFDAGTALPLVLNFALGLAVILFVILIVVGGIQYLAAAGNEEAEKKARTLLVSAVVGFILIIGSWAIMLFVFRLFSYAF
jgi:uncharacterized membrane protein YidH (DUF202 family)